MVSSVPIYNLNKMRFKTLGVFCRTPPNIAMSVSKLIMTIETLAGMASGEMNMASQAMMTKSPDGM